MSEQDGCVYMMPDRALSSVTRGANKVLSCLNNDSISDLVAEYVRRLEVYRRSNEKHLSTLVNQNDLMNFKLTFNRHRQGMVKTHKQVVDFVIKRTPECRITNIDEILRPPYDLGKI